MLNKKFSMTKISVVLFLTCFFLSCTQKEQPVDNVTITLQNNNKNAILVSRKTPPDAVLAFKKSNKRSLPDSFILQTNLDELPVIKLQKSDSVFVVEGMISGLDSNNSETPVFSITLLLTGGLVFFLVLLFFIVRKKKQSHIKKQHVHDTLVQQHQSEIPVELLENTEKEDYNSNTIDLQTVENIELYSKLLTYYQNEKPYLNANLKAIDVAKALNTSHRTLTAIIKANGLNGFSNFNNKYRVEEVIRQFKDPNYSSIKMEAISSNAGFGNRQTFYDAFEEFTGLNPGFYRSEFLKQ